jgi:tetratricopeptide (TPR) repeat protein
MELYVKNSICLNMIVKNESRIITRLFDSVLSIIDCYCICDTGSTDNTVQIITDYFKDKGINGKVVTEPFKNFCYNRNFALESCLGMSDYVLLLDADMVLDVLNFTKKSLSEFDHFAIFQGNESFYYQNVRILKNNGKYKYIGVTHEYIDSPSNSKICTIEKKNLFIKDFGDGGAKHDKFERDIRLLTEGIKEDPNNVRYYFYLANSYHDSGKFNEAIDFYKKRIELGGWHEEVWYSYYRIGLCYKNLNKMIDAINYWMEGFDYYPKRLEGLYEIIKHYRIISKHKLAFLFYEQSKKNLDLNPSMDGALFLQNDVYTCKLYYEFTIFAAYLGITSINKEIVICLNNLNTFGEISNLLQNKKFYKDILKPLYVRKLDNTIMTNINNEDVKFYSSSSCLIPDIHRSGYKMNIRYVNYHITPNGNYMDCDKHIITSNKIISLDKNFNCLNEKWMEMIFDNRRYIGIEDVRIFHDISSNNLLYIGTSFRKDLKIGISSGVYDIESCKFIGNDINSSFSNSGCEKNWVFVDYKDSTHVIYNWSPLNICKINDKNELHNIENKPMPNIFKLFRGSSCGFNYYNNFSQNSNENINIIIEEKEIWFVTHLVSYEQPRHYYHVIVVFDANLNLLRYSAPFKFEGEPIEYCLSIVVEDDRVILNYSTWDRTTRMGVYDKKYIDSLLIYN